ncbi:MAG TPA: ABC transporter ATP-binding protein [Patescibacteria group bacterium]|jgi:ABC-type nitrate/sulfonate/bicarbonate transport system ATPase subunit|nr:ABC transporter ATP-binding protein [Patescibacteria group bacterium]
MSALLKISNITQTFSENGRHLTVLHDISMEVKQGEFLMILGPSGSGKSTLLRIMAGLMAPTSGKIITAPDTTHSFIFQSFALFPWLSVADNVGFGLKMQQRPEHEIKKIVAEEIARMGLEGFEKSFPRELSGGMKQRVGIARALAMKPSIIFLDEPFSALDSFTATKLRADLLKIWQEQNITLVMVTHLIDEAIQLGDRIAVLSNRPARIEHIFHNPISRPRDTRAEKFFELYDTINKVIKI